MNNMHPMHPPMPGGHGGPGGFGGMRGPRKNISEFFDVVYLKPDNASFFETKGGLLGVKTFNHEKKEEYNGRVLVFRMFPFSNENNYISVRDTEENELGIIEDMSVFDTDTRALITKELDRRYFTPKILSTISVKESFGYIYFDVETSAGQKQFTVGDISNAMTRIGDRLILTDVSGSRYEIEDLKKADEKIMKHIEIWL